MGAQAKKDNSELVTSKTDLEKKLQDQVPLVAELQEDKQELEDKLETTEATTRGIELDENEKANEFITLPWIGEASKKYVTYVAGGLSTLGLGWLFGYFCGSSSNESPEGTFDELQDLSNTTKAAAIAGVAIPAALVGRLLTSKCRPAPQESSSDSGNDGWVTNLKSRSTAARKKKTTSSIRDYWMVLVVLVGMSVALFFFRKNQKTPKRNNPYEIGQRMFFEKYNEDKILATEPAKRIHAITIQKKKSPLDMARNLREIRRNRLAGNRIHFA